jgi:hypothetical protein
VSYRHRCRMRPNCVSGTLAGELVLSRGPIASSEAELDAIEEPIREAFSDFLAKAGLRRTKHPLLAMTFRTGGLHFAAKALQFVPADLPIVIVGTNLTAAEQDYIRAVGRPVFNSTRRYDNELVYEMLMANTAGPFGWVDADCLVVDDQVWQDLLSPMASDVGAHTAFTYEPLGFAKSVLPVFGSTAREILTAERTTLNSYALEPTNVGRAAPHAISRILQPYHHRYLEQVLGVEADGGLRPHDGFLDIFENGRTVNTRKRDQSRQWFGDSVRRTGWLIDTPMMAEVVLRAKGMKTHRVIESNREISPAVIHVGASSYRERMREEGATTSYLARFKLTDLFEVILAEELAERGVTEPYTELARIQKHRLEAEAGVGIDEVRAAARAILHDQGVAMALLSEDPRFAFLF